jgi:hypothetical protein
MNEHIPTPEEARRQMEEAREELDRSTAQTPTPHGTQNGGEERVPTYVVVNPEKAPTPDQIIKEENLGVK